MLLFAYPIMLALVVGGVIATAGSQPRVAFVDQDHLPASLDVGGQRLSLRDVLSQTSQSVTLVPMGQAQATRALDRGDVVAAIVVPPGFTAQLRTLVASPSLVLETNANALQDRVRREAEALVYRLNLRLQQAEIAANLSYLGALVNGGDVSFLGRRIAVLGLGPASADLDRVRTRLPAGSDGARRITTVQNFARQAGLALGEARAALAVTAHPIQLRVVSRNGRAFLLSSQVQSDGLAILLSFVGLLVAAGALAVEREEHVLGRLRRGLVGPGQLIGAKIVVTAIASLVLGALLALAFAVSVALSSGRGEPWLRLPLLVPVLLVAGASIGACGALLGALARDVRTAAVGGIALAVPFVLLGILPAQASGLAQAVSALFPFAATQRAFSAVLFDASPAGTLAGALGHLALLCAVYGGLATLALRRAA